MDSTQILSVFGVEAWLGLLAVLLIALDLVTGKGRLTGPADVVRVLALGGLAAILAYAFVLQPETAPTGWGTLDAFALYFKRFFVAAALLTLLISAPYEARLPAGRGEFPAL